MTKFEMSKYFYLKYARVFFRLIVAICLFVMSVFYVYTELMWTDLQPLPNDNPCTASLNISREEAQAKVNSYSFPEAHTYLTVLFPAPANRSGVSTSIAFVSASSSGHFGESLALIQNFNSVVRRKYTNITFIFYNIGLRKSHRHKIAQLCNCEVRDFPFQNYPRHIRYLKGYAWKPIAIQLIAREHKYVVWMDASIRFRTSDLEPLFKQVRRQGVVTAGPGVPSVAANAVYNLFKYLNETPCTFSKANEIYATFIVFYVSDFISEYVLKPWVSCALSYGCMVPNSIYLLYLDCTRYTNIYFNCHRFDQSVLGILFYRLFSQNAREHFIPHDVLHICKGNNCD